VQRDVIRKAATGFAGAATAVLLSVTGAAVPAGATTTTATAGATWSTLMRRKFVYDARTVELTRALPALRTAVTAKAAALTQARRVQTAAAAPVATATAADDAARVRYGTARTTAATAAAALTAAQHHRPLRASQVTLAARAVKKANAAVQVRAAEVTQTTAALATATTAYATATRTVTTDTAAYQAATKAVTDTQAQLVTLPRTSAALLASARALGAQVVTQTRGTFTTAQTTQVYGITVNKVIAYSFQRMIDDAATAGIRLSGGGFRTQASQIALRKANGCPDVWTAPSSSCRVPTAIPGRSLHEIGLAIDLTTGGRTITDRNSAAYRWLAANAGKYGFTNLPSEAWHWSITGN
jgi:zinc D-Ala-D-Ala carboxypeptidase